MNIFREKKPNMNGEPARFFAGFTLFELVVTLTVLSIVVMGTIPLAQNAVRRQNETRLRDTLRQIRNAIDEFRRDAIGACPMGAFPTGQPGGARGSRDGARDYRRMGRLSVSVLQEGADDAAAASPGLRGPGSFRFQT